MQLIFAWLLISCTAGFLTGCGYHAGEDGIAAQYRTLSVPGVKGDIDGDLTSAIVEKISMSGCFEYHRDCGAATLFVELIDVDEENVGFRYDRHKDGKIRKWIIPTETRLIATAEVTLVEFGSGRTLLGPVRLTASIDFDHDYYTCRNGVNIFSLGQLTDYDEAYDAAYHPLNRALAQKIVDFICDSW